MKFIWKNKRISIGIHLAFFSLFIGELRSQSYRSDDIKTYIETYCNLAVQEMMESKIPASITLAQGILESNATFIREKDT